jgi:hypothetical protein
MVLTLLEPLEVLVVVAGAEAVLEFLVVLVLVAQV